MDPLVGPVEMLHVIDADSSQTLALAIHEVRRGRNLVIQEPPGTGKSQTIANIIASAVASGKTVLFVAKMMAALWPEYCRLHELVMKFVAGHELCRPFRPDVAALAVGDVD